MNKKTILGAVLIVSTGLIIFLKLFFQESFFQAHVYFVIVLLAIFYIVLFLHLYYRLKRYKKERSVMLGNAESVTKIAAEILSTKMKTPRWFNIFFRAKGTYDGREAWMKCYVPAMDMGLWKMHVTIVPKRIQKPNRLFVITLPKPTQYTVTKGKLVEYQLTNQGSGGIVVDSDKSFTREEIIAIFNELTKAAEIVEQGLPYYKE